ncbi:MAG: capsule biosynthesis protein CapA [Bacteroidetes bacterium HGW-Bacteroidetes-21]|jgi:poly-gamma-glutamate synthesis protein (capsule biosynthesis protein)|nr:MAG: capsule biosynthesis protein CapA [Bacteroidetes bacterium HGW-Bacteroidetes-21]
MKFLIIPLILLYFSLWVSTDPSENAESTPQDSLQKDSTEVLLLFSGDVMQHMPQINAAWDTSCQCYNYDSTFAYISPLFNMADIAIINLETTLAGKPYSGYPQFTAPDELVTGLQKAGIDILATSNNHSCDKGRKGIERTLKIIDSLGLQRTGTFYDSLDQKLFNPLYIEVKGLKIALLNYTYGTNGILTPKPTIVNRIDTSAIRRDYHTAIISGADIVIPFFHWGIEYQTAPNEEQKMIAEFCMRLGMKLIIGSHPHVIQPAQTYISDKDTAIVVWSLGNFVSNQRQINTDGGMSVMVKLIKEERHYKVINTGYILHWVYIQTDSSGKKTYKVLPISEYQKKTSALTPDALEKMNLFDERTKTLITTVENPIKEITFDSLSNKWVF